MYTWLPLAETKDLAQIEKHIPPEYGPDRVSNILIAGISSAVKSVLIETDYVDKDYRSTFYNFYSKKGCRYRSDCIRLHFFDETISFSEASLSLSGPDDYLDHHYFGYMILRPTGIATIGRTVLSPDVRVGASRLILTTKHKVHLLGYKLAVNGFPSMNQHVDISVCAHAACWSILRHYSERYCLYREFSTHDITMMAHDFNPGGLIPSMGLQMAHAERVFQEAGTFPVHVARNAAGAGDHSFYRQLCAYIESGFPLFTAMHGRGHAIATVGYEWRPPLATGVPGLRYAWDEINSLAVVDDNHLPYMSIPKSGGGNYSAEDIDSFIVPLPEKIFYPADAVDRLSPTLFRLGQIVDLPPEDKTIIRYFVTTGSALREFMRARASEFDPSLLEIVMTLPLAQFVWVVEFATEAQWAAGKVEARAVIDATASLRETNPLWLFHGRGVALVFDRQQVGTKATGVGTIKLADTGHLGFSRMDRNLRPTQTK